MQRAQGWGGRGPGGARGEPGKVGLVYMLDVKPLRGVGGSQRARAGGVWCLDAKREGV